MKVILILSTLKVCVKIVNSFIKLRCFDDCCLYLFAFHPHSQRPLVHYTIVNFHLLYKYERAPKECTEFKYAVSILCICSLNFFNFRKILAFALKSKKLLSFNLRFQFLIVDQINHPNVYFLHLRSGRVYIETKIDGGLFSDGPQIDYVAKLIKISFT